MKKEYPTIHRFNSLPSTNSKLIVMNKESKLPELSVVVSSAQTAGKGQVGNSWESEDGKNLTFSILLHPDSIPIQDQFIITQLITLALIKVLRPIVKDVCIKWPNDIYCNDKKIAGILVENSLKGSQIEDSVIGVGLNVNQEKFSNNLPLASSLYMLTKMQYNLDELLNNLIIRFTETYLDWQINQDDELLHKEYMDNLYRKDGFHPFTDSEGEFLASIFDIKPSGHLLLKSKQGEIRTYAFKEVGFL